MNILKRIFFSLMMFFATFSFAQAPELPTLTIAVDRFSPPFMTMGPNNTYLGFDADMMRTLCQKINRACEFVPWRRFDDVLPAVSAGELDMAIGVIAITAERAKLVNFSFPYMIIYLRFLTRTQDAKTPFSYAQLNNKRIGSQSGTLLQKYIKSFSIVNPKIKTYRSIEEEILALSEGKVDYVLIDNDSAIYWQNNSSGTLSVVGPPIPTKYAMGIAVDPNQPQLVDALNQALKQYFQDGGYKANYDRYILQFQSTATKNN